MKDKHRPRKKIKIGKDYLTLTHYKEPLLPVPKKEGYGFYGALLSTLDGEFVQCHICGKFFKSVGKHAEQKHKIKVRDYKVRFQLAFKTALISEKERERRKERTLKWLASLTEEEKRNFRTAGLKGYWARGKGQPKLQLETLNKRGTCPPQILEKIKEVRKKLKRVPTLKEFIWETGSQRYKHLIYKVFGSWNKALQLLNYPLNPPSTGGGRRNYTDEELLEYLNIYAQENHKIPTATDCNRGLLPSYCVYLRRFGSIEKARRLAGVYDFVD